MSALDCYQQSTAKGKGLRHPGTISRNGDHRVAVALIPRLQAIEIADLEALTGQHLDKAN
jgi:hypothetical protein